MHPPTSKQQCSALTWHDMTWHGRRNTWLSSFNYTCSDPASGPMPCHDWIELTLIEPNRLSCVIFVSFHGHLHGSFIVHALVSYHTRHQPLPSLQIIQITRSIHFIHCSQFISLWVIWVVWIYFTVGIIWNMFVCCLLSFRHLKPCHCHRHRYLTYLLLRYHNTNTNTNAYIGLLSTHTNTQPFALCCSQ